MSVSIIHMLEIINIQKQYGKGFLKLRFARNSPFQYGLKQAPVRQMRS